MLLRIWFSFIGKMRWIIISSIAVLLMLSPLQYSINNSSSSHFEKTNFIHLETNIAFGNVGNVGIVIPKAEGDTPREKVISGAANPDGGKEESASDITKYMNCSLQGFDGLTGCIAGMAYGIYTFTSFVLAAVGNFFDIVLLFSISRDLINQDFVKTVWTNVRDLANMAFIFILLWIAIATILQVKNNTAKDLLTRLVF